MLRNMMPSATGEVGFSLGHRGPGAAEPPRTAPASWGRHGSGARGTTLDGFGGALGLTPPTSHSPRRRTRDDSDHRDRENSRDGRRTRRGEPPQHAMDMDDEMSNLVNRLRTVETTLRQHAQGLATNTQNVATIMQNMPILETTMNKEVEDRKELDERMRTGGERIADRISALDNQCNAKLLEIETMLHSLVASMNTVSAGVTAAAAEQQFRTRHNVEEQPLPQVHNLGTVDPRVAAPSDARTPSPWSQAQNESLIHGAAPQNGVQAPLFNIAGNMPTQPLAGPINGGENAGRGTPATGGHRGFGPGGPGGFGPNNGGPNGPSGFGPNGNHGAGGNGGGGGGGPGGYPGAGGGGGGPSGHSPSGPGNFRPGGNPGGGGGGGPGGPGGGGGWSNQHPRTGSTDNWHIDRKVPKNLLPWDGRWETYKCFRDMAEDHMVSCNPKWHWVIEQIEAEKTPLTLTKIANSNLIPGVSTTDLAHEIYSFLGTIIAASVHKKRVRLAGGEKGNGMEMWRRMYFDNAGGGELADLSGEKFFFNFPRCTNPQHLHDHLEEWLEMRYKHGSGIDDKHLRIMFLSTLPQALEDEISMKHDLGNRLSDAVDYVQARTNRSREREMVDRLAKGRKAALGVNALTPGPTISSENIPAPDIVNQLIHALNNGTRKPERGRPTGRSTPNRSRTPSPRGGGQKKVGKPDPKSGTCWYCQKPGHTKQQCPDYLAWCEKNGKNPLGTRNNKPSDKPRVAALHTDSDTESENSVNEGASQINMFACLANKQHEKPPVAVKNSFDVFKDFDNDEGDDEEAVLAHLGSFAHFVEVKSKKRSQKQRKRERANLKLPAGMSTDYKHALKVMANLKATIPISNDEEYALVDSSSAVHGNNASKHFKHVPVTPSNKKLNCTTADGSQMSGSGGYQSVVFETDEGHTCAVDFDDLPVAMPILAVKLLTKKGHNVEFDDDLGGGCITHKKTGQKTKIIEMDGVYFLRMRKIRPGEPTRPFGRPGKSS